MDFKNKIYVIGTTTSTNQPDATHSFPATLGAIQVTSLGTTQFFMSKVDPTLIGLPSLAYSTYFGGGNPPTGLPLAAESPWTPTPMSTLPAAPTFSTPAARPLTSRSSTRIRDAWTRRRR